VLTTPVIRCVKEQLNAEIHFLTKEGFRGILEYNPHLTRVWSIKKDLDEVAADLQNEGFTSVIDLHNNLRCRMLSFKLWHADFYRFNKLNREKWLLTNFKINRLPDVHIVQRYLATAAPLGVVDDGKGLEYYPGDAVVDYGFLGEELQSSKERTEEQSQLASPPYLAFVIGAAHATKRLTEAKIIAFCQTYQGTTLLLGGPAEKEQGERIAQFAGDHVVNTCGKFSLHQSAILVRDAAAVRTHDTGMMHIAAAFHKPIISVWGNTVPDFGMYPYLPGQEEVEKTRRVEVKGLGCRPCSKIGYAECPKGHFRCVEDISITEIVEKVEGVLVSVSQLSELPDPS
jgi:ADP-heptose:LPS heptosyltransferase